MTPIDVVALIAVAVPVTLSSLAVARRLAAPPDRAVRALVTVTLAVAGTASVAKALGAVGWLHAAGIVAATWVLSAGLWGASRRIPPRPVECDAHRSPTPARLAAVASVALVAAVWASHGWDVVHDGVTDWDSVTYHLPFANDYAAGASPLDLLHAPPEYTSTFQPHETQLLGGVVIALSGSEVAFLTLGPAMAALTLVAAYAIGAPRGLGATAVCAVGLWLSTGTVAHQADGAKNDVTAAAILLVAVALALRLRRSRGADVVVGLALGTAVAVKLTMWPGAAVLAAVHAWRVRGAPRRLAWFAIPVAAPVTPWLLRNVLRAGHPVPLLGAGIGPLEPLRTRIPDLAEIQDRFGPPVIEYAFDADFWVRFGRPGLVSAFGPAWPLLLGGAAVAVVVGRTRPDRAVDLMRGMAAVAFAAYVVTPYGAAGRADVPSLFPLATRFGYHALLLGLVVLVLTLPRAASAVAWASLAVQAVTVFRSGGALPTLVDGRAGVTVGVVLVVAVGAVLATRSGARPRLVAWSAAAAALLGVAVLQSVHEDRRFDGHAPEAALRAFADERPGARIAVVAIHEYHLLYGDGRQVDHLGPPGPYGSFASHRTCDAFMEAIRGGRYEAVVVGTWKRWLETAPEQSWASDHPGLVAAGSSEDVDLYEVTPGGPATSCAADEPAVRQRPA